MTNTATVIGAGIVGVCCALELRQRGMRVTLIDRRSPGRETSYGNAGVISRGSLIPFNHPGLWGALPRLIRNRSAQLRYNPIFVARNAAWVIGFMARARRSAFEETAAALDALLRLSVAGHKRLLVEAGVSHRLRDSGFLLLYRSAAGYAGSRMARDIFDRFDVRHETLDRYALSDLEPDLAPVFDSAVWLKDAWSVDSPGRVVEAYASLFAARGGVIERREITGLERDGPATWRLRDSAGNVSATERVIVALGPWAKGFLAPLGLSVPMAFERGYHMHYGVQASATLGRPVYDTACAYVLTPMEHGVRLTTGVELTFRDAPKNLAQLDLAEKSALEAFPLGKRLDANAWLGRRPTLPDSRPMIGAAPRHRGVWLAFGHQHIGFSTGPGTACLLAELICGERASIDPAPFMPQRFLA